MNVEASADEELPELSSSSAPAAASSTMEEVD